VIAEPIAAVESAAHALSRLTHHRWALPVLAHVTRHRGCKFVTLTRQLGVAPPGLKRALARLAELDLVVRNPGYGHPMRPEYVLGALGERAGALATEIDDWVQAAQLGGEVLKKWQLPVLAALEPDVQRFGAVRRVLPTATPRALTLALKGNAGLGLVARTVDVGYPPVPRYAPTRKASAGRAPARLLGEILAA